MEGSKSRDEGKGDQQQKAKIWANYNRLSPVIGQRLQWGRREITGRAHSKNCINRVRGSGSKRLIEGFHSLRHKSPDSGNKLPGSRYEAGPNHLVDRHTRTRLSTSTYPLGCQWPGIPGTESLGGITTSLMEDGCREPGTSAYRFKRAKML